MGQLTSALWRYKGQIQHALKANSPAILTAIGVSGTVTTAYLAGRASFEAARVIDKHETRAVRSGKGVAEDPKQRLKDRTVLVWRLYIPAATCGVVTIGCIIAANKVGARRTAAITAAYSLSEKAFTEYKEKVAETFGEKKEQSIRDSIAQDKVTKNPPGSNGLVIAGSGHILCCELFTKRYFNSDMESLKKAMNEVNARINREGYADLEDFYFIIGLPYTSQSSKLGWNSDKLLDLYFSTALTEDGKPCITFDYNYTKPI